MRRIVLAGLLSVLACPPGWAQPGSTADLIEAGRRHTAAGETAAALAAFRDVLRRDPGNAIAHNALGAILNATGHYAEALPHAEAAVAAAPGELRYRYNRGVVRAEHGRFAEAVADFDAALGADSNLMPGSNAARR